MTDQGMDLIHPCMIGRFKQEIIDHMIEIGFLLVNFVPMFVCGLIVNLLSFP